MTYIGAVLLTPSSVEKTGASSTATINTNGSVSFSACASLSLNGIFSSNYTNYQIIMRQNSTNSSTWVLQYRLRVSGSDSTTGYTYQRLDADSTTIGGTRDTPAYWYFAGATNGSYEGGITWVYGPYIASPTAFRSNYTGGYTGAWVLNYLGTHSESASYDGISMIAYDGTMSGRLSVLGMRK